MPEPTIDADTILSWLHDRIAQELNCETKEVDFTQPLDLLGLDSVSLLWIAGELGEWLDIEITTAMVFESRSLPEFSKNIFRIHSAKESGDRPAT